MRADRIVAISIAFVNTWLLLEKMLAKSSNLNHSSTIVLVGAYLQLRTSCDSIPANGY